MLVPAHLTRTRRLVVPCLLATVVLALLAAPATGEASAGEGAYQTASLRFVESAPGRASGYGVRIDYMNPDDPGAKPPSVRRVVEVFPRGTRIDTSAPARCRATDAELMLQGRSACPRRSIVGAGFIRLDTGTPGPGRFLREDVTFLNNTDQLIYLTRDRANGARTVLRARVVGRRVISEAPFLPGAPPDGTAVDVVRASFPKLVSVRDGQRRAYTTTPAHCPRRGHWVTRVRFTYDDGTRQTEATRNRCGP
jgi:hypothetical protein